MTASADAHAAFGTRINGSFFNACTSIYNPGAQLKFNRDTVFGGQYLYLIGKLVKHSNIIENYKAASDPVYFPRQRKSSVNRILNMALKEMEQIARLEFGPTANGFKEIVYLSLHFSFNVIIHSLKNNGTKSLMQLFSNAQKAINRRLCLSLFYSM